MENKSYFNIYELWVNNRFFMYMCENLKVMKKTWPFFFLREKLGTSGNKYSQSMVHNKCNRVA